MGLVALADRIAAEAHAGQVDQAGAPYIDHPRRVAASLDTPEAQAVAVLHDVLEDTALTVWDLWAEGVPSEVTEAVEVLTCGKGEDYLGSFIPRCGANPLARRVKLADLADNLRPERLALLPAWKAERLAQRYEAARALLSEVKDGT
jgi:hypothetical protein